MEATNISTVLRRFLVACTLSIFTVLASCGDNSTGPAPTDGNPPGTNATVEVSDPVPAQEAAEVRSNAQRNANDTLVVSMDEVIAIALQQAGGGELMGVTLDYDTEELNYECVVRQGGKVYVVVIDPQTGTVKSKDTTESYYYPQIIVIRPIVVKVKEAKEKAKKYSNGDVVECKLENVEGRPTYIIVIINQENRYVTVYIDAEDGKERKLKNEGRCEDDDNDGKKKHKRGKGHYRHGKGKGYGHHHHCRCECDDDDDDDSTKVPAGIISVDSVRTITNAMLDSVTINEVKLQVKNDSTASYDVKVTRDSNRYEISYNAFNGSFMSIKQTHGDFSDSSDFQPAVPGDTLVKLSVARTAAKAQVAGDVTAWKLEYDATEAKWIYTFEIKPSNGPKKEVLVDAKTGTFIRIK